MLKVFVREARATVGDYVWGQVRFSVLGLTCLPMRQIKNRKPRLSPAKRFSRNADDKKFWDGAMGEGFNDWYLKSLVESAKAPEPANPPPQQLDLPGFESIGSETSCPLNSF